MIFLFFDNRYFDWAEPYLRSVGVFEPDEKIYIRTFNFSKRQIRDIKMFNRNIVEVLNTKEELIRDRKIYNPLAYKGKARPREETNWMIQIISQRYGFLLDAMRKYPNEESWFHSDIDLFIIKPFLNEFRKMSEDFDVLLFCKGSAGKGGMSAALLLVKNNEGGHRFLERTDHFLKTRRPLIQGCDQHALRVAYNACMKNLESKIELVDRTKFWGIEWRRDLIFWCGSKTKLGTKRRNLACFREMMKDMHENVNMKIFLKKYGKYRGKR